MTTTMQLIAKQTVGASGAASVTFSNIPQTYTDLKVVCTMRTDRSATEDPVTITFNTGGTYSDIRIWANGSSVASYSASTLNAEYANSTSSTSNTFNNFEMYIPNYTSSNAKSISYDSVTENNATTGYDILDAALWTKTPQEAITSITFDPIYGNFVQYCTFYLYGISNSTTTQNETVPYASGGDVITTDGSYWYHTFLYSGTFTPLKNLTCDYLVVAGGGGGGAFGGGGGAGGLRSTVGSTGGGGSLETPLSLTSGTAYTATVGAGGAGGTCGNQVNRNKGVKGSNSVFATITSTGGGAGAGFDQNTPSTDFDGGSGGGGANSASAPGYINGGAANPSGQGYAGGRGYRTNSSYNAFGGGGGAGTAGVDGSGSGSSPVAGTGGSGLALSISGSSVTYGVGGVGGAEIGSGADGVAGTANRGNGGGASTGATAGQNTPGGAGGSGIIVVRYAV